MIHIGFMKSKKIFLAMPLAVIMASGIPAFAHHSYSSFDMSQTVDIKGTVKEFHYQNPHSLIVILTKDASGAEKEFSIEGNGPSLLVGHGWHRDSLKPGDEITITVNPMRDGSSGGSLNKVTFPDGHSLDTQ